ncbi:hypothetical protein P3X46_028971 [Hevea brasiliensis]|uniref:SHSP domain-containing protein n=1 Tax=Hevea brasiliensis TaxID=3981 RepID=A0ABQ9KQT2_HEVBR|nr:uncharacterized protein LOC131174674 [Hevea brasiliensis]KAJ9146740.1 hypothetical protein P3X46_028971 [Hevea brasiliensis]
MLMIPSGFGVSSCLNASNNLNSSSFSNLFGFSDPFSITMYWQETTFVVTANLQGLKTEDVKVEIRGRNVLLIIGGSRPNCKKSCQLPYNVNVEMTATSFSNGLLIVKVPKQSDVLQKKQNHPVVAHVTRCRFGSFFY